MTTVYHVETTRPFDPEAALAKAFARDTSAVLSLISTGRLDVREVAIFPEDISLDAAFLYTNTIHGPWYIKSIATINMHGADGLRSTSVGDIIEKAGVYYVVSVIGFDAIDIDPAIIIK